MKSPYELATDLLCDPKRRTSASDRKKLMGLRVWEHTSPPARKVQPQRVSGTSAKLDKANAKRDARGKQGEVKTNSNPKPAGEKYIVKLSTFTMAQLIRRLKQAARVASHFKHRVAQHKGSGRESAYQTLQDNALLCLSHIETEIKFRDRGASK
jgi:hypothetical protein